MAKTSGNELAVGYISIIPETSKIAPGINKAFQKVDGGVSGAGATAGSGFMAKAGTAMKGAAVGVGAVVGGVLGTAVAKGFDRLNAIDQANAKLSGLGHSAGEVRTIMDDAMASVKGTAYGLGDAATVAASTVAAGIAPGQDLQRTLKLVGDAAAIAGTDMSSMGSIFNKVAASNKIQGDVIAQLSDAGIPVIKLLGEEMGKTAEEVYEMAASGEIDFATFQNAMEKGMGGAALKAGQTFQGSMDNAKAALGRLGEALIGPAFQAAPGIITKATEKIDVLTNAVKGAYEIFQTGDFNGATWSKIGVMEDDRLIDWLFTAREEFIKFKTALTGGDVEGTMGSLGASVRSIGESFKEAWPSIQQIGISLGEAGLKASVVSITTALGVLAPVIAQILLPILQTMANWMTQNQGAVNGLVMAFVGFKTLKFFLGPIGSLVSSLKALNTGAKVARGTLGISGGTNLVGAIKGFTTATAQAAPKGSLLARTMGGLNKAGSLASKAFGFAKKIPGVSKVIGVLGKAFGPVGSIITKVAAKFGAKGLIGMLGKFALRAVPFVGTALMIVDVLKLFFTKTEIGKRIWAGFMDKLKSVWAWMKDTFAPVFTFLGDTIGTAWSAIQDYFSWGWSNLQSVFGWISNAWSTVWGGLQTAWETVGKPVIDAIWTIISTTLGVIATIILAPLIIAWNLLSAAFSFVWTNMLQPIFSGIGTVVMWLWTNVLQPIFTVFIPMAWNMLGAAISFVWNSIIKPVWDALSFVANWLWTSVLQPIFGFIQAAWGVVGQVFSFIWNSIIKPTWDALGMGIQFVWNTIIRPVWDALKAALGAVGAFFQFVWNSIIKPAWDALGNGIRWVIDNVARPAFDGLKSALGAVGDFFRTVVDGIRSVWDSLRGALAKPINFMINTVYNNGILRAWNTVADFIPNLKHASPVAGIPEHASGGKISGPGTGTSDDVLMWGSNGEHMLTEKEVSKSGGHGVIYAMRNFLNAGRSFSWKDGRLFSEDRKPKKTDNRPLQQMGLPAYRNGGEVRPAWEEQLERGHQWARSVNGRPYLTGSQWDNGGDCSGYMSAIASVITGAAPNAGHWATPAFPAGQSGNVSAGGQNWVGGLSKGFSIGVKGGPDSGGQNGHTAGTLSAVGSFSAVNVESGGSHGNVAYGGPAAGGDDGQFPTRYHLGIGADGAFESAGGPSPEQQKGLLRKKVQEIFDKLLDPIKGMFATYVGTPPPEWFGIPPEALTFSKTKSVDFLFDAVENLGGKLRGTYDKAKNTVGAIGSSIANVFRDQGGWIPQGTSMVTNHTGRPEAVLNWAQIQKISELMRTTGTALASGNKAVDLSDGDVALLQSFARNIGLDSSDKVDPEWRSKDIDAPRWDLIGTQIAGTAGNSIAKDLLGLVGLKGSWLKDPDLVDDRGRLKKDSTSASVASVSESAQPETTSAVAVTDTAKGKELKPVNIKLDPMPDLADDSTPASGGSVKSTVQSIFAKRGWTGQAWADADWIINKESSWNPRARNPSSGAFGLFQFLGSTKQQYLPDENPDPGVQGKAGARYIADRYGNPQKARQFWQANGWYDKGGIAGGVGLMAKATIKPERVLSPAQTQAFEDLVYSQLPDLAEIDADASTGDQVVINVDTGNERVADEVERRLSRRDRSRGRRRRGF